MKFKTRVEVALFLVLLVAHPALAAPATVVLSVEGMT